MIAVSRLAMRLAPMLLVGLASLGFAQSPDAAAGDKRANDKPAADKKGEPSSLDKQLLEDLGGDLPEGLDIPAKAKEPAGKGNTSPTVPPERPASESPGQKPSPQPDEDASKASDTDRKLLDDFEGEDVDLADDAGNPLISIGRRMKQVERLIGERNTSTATQNMQQQIVGDLDRLIEQLRQQAKKSQGSRSRSSRSSPGMPAPKPGDRESKNPAEDSQTRVGSAERTTVDPRDLENLLKDVWGHLPERVRRQMLSGTAEQVLPKYQKLTEEYYKRLAEDAAKTP